MSTYKIVRKYRNNSHPNHNKVILSGLTLEEAQGHCNDPSTHEEGVWFDCYYEEPDLHNGYLVRKGYPKVSMTTALTACYNGYLYSFKGGY